MFSRREIYRLNSCNNFCDVIDNALLHLYLTVAETSRFTPKARRNEILVRYLKPMIKNKQYKEAKKDLQGLVAMGRLLSCDLESKLIEFRDLSLRFDKNAIDAKRLFDLLTIVERELDFPTLFQEGISNAKRVPNIIYMVQEDVENGFIESGEQVAPLSLFLESDKILTLIDMINETGLFQAEVQQLNPTVKQGHIVLHPKNLS